VDVRGLQLLFLCKNLSEYQASKNKSHGHPGSTFAGNQITGSLTKNNSEPWTNATPATTGALYLEYENMTYFIQTGTQSASRVKKIGFSATPSGTVTIAANGSVSKPPTVAFMWICRYC